MVLIFKVILRAGDVDARLESDVAAALANEQVDLSHIL
jgi:hypothetical protein